MQDARSRRSFAQRTLGMHVSLAMLRLPPSGAGDAGSPASSVPVVPETWMNATRPSAEASNVSASRSVIPSERTPALFVQTLIVVWEPVGVPCCRNTARPRTSA
jgi:hypothetical protein